MTLVVAVTLRVRVLVGKSDTVRVKVWVPCDSFIDPPAVRPLPYGLPFTVTFAGGSTTNRNETGSGVAVALGSGVTVGVAVLVAVLVGVAVRVGVEVAVGIHGGPASPKTRS